MKKNQSKVLASLVAMLFVLVPAQGVLAGGDKGDTAFTAWAIVFNNAAACVDGCGEDDVPRPGVAAAVIFLTGQRVQSNGRAIFAGAITANSRHRQIGGPSPAGILYPDTAEIHVGLLPHPKGSLSGDAASRHGEVTRPCMCDFAQAAIFLPGAATGSVVDPATGEPVDGAAATIDRIVTGVTISVDTRL